jgi:uncharacterized membrane protein YbhN (UPF0104 family)
MMHNLHLRGTNVVLVPQPSNDPNDPLRWSTWKKYFAFLNVCLFAAMTTGFISGFSPALYLLGLEFKKDLSGTSGLITWPLLVSGLGVSIVHAKRSFVLRDTFLTKPCRTSSGYQLPSTLANVQFLSLRLSFYSVRLSDRLCRQASEACFLAVSLPPSADLPLRHWVPQLSMFVTSPHYAIAM